MSRLYYHEKSDRRKWAAITIVVLLIIAAIVLGVLSNWYTDFNKYCVFGHDYGDDGKCVRCGKEKPIENEPEVEPQAFISEPYSMRVASAKKLNASATSSNIPSGYRALKVGDKLSDVESIAIDMFAVATSRQSDNLQDLLFNTNDGSIDVFMIYPDAFGFVDKNFTGRIYWDEDAGDEIAVGYDNYIIGDLDHDRIDENNRFYITTPHNLETSHLEFGDTVTAVGQYPVYVKIISTVVPPAPTKTGYTFTGWYTDEACTNKYTASTVTADITLYAGFRAHTYSIKFNANSGSGTMANEPMTYDQAKNLTTNSFTKDHYAFKGWATSADGNIVYSNGQSVKNLTATDGAVIELFAVWERSEVSVTFVSEGNTVATTWIAIGTKATLPSNPVKEGHTFNGWYYEDDTKYGEQTISEDITLTAKFDIIRCTVTFIVDGEVYAVYVCDWGTSLADALKANDVNPVLLKTEDEYSRNF